MDQLRDLSDNRLVQGCIYCGDVAETRDHVPSKAFLDAPFPENLPVVGACGACNNGFSDDEEYLACLVECTIAGTTDPNAIQRSKIKKSLEHSPALRKRIQDSFRERNGVTFFEPDAERVCNVLIKLARGHAAFELSRLCFEKPYYVHCFPIHTLNPDQYKSFDEAHYVDMFGEVGSRGLQRTMIIQATVKTADDKGKDVGFLMVDWVEVQPGRYRYLAADHGEQVVVKFVISDYLGCEVCWSELTQ